MINTHGNVHGKKREMKEMFRDVQRQGKEKGGCDNMRATKEYRLKVTEEAQKIVDQLTLEQKVSLMRREHCGSE